MVILFFLLSELYYTYTIFSHMFFYHSYSILYIQSIHVLCIICDFDFSYIRYRKHKIDNTQTQMFLCVCMCVCMYVRMCVCVCVSRKIELNFISPVISISSFIYIYLLSILLYTRPYFISSPSHSSKRRYICI